MKFGSNAGVWENPCPGGGGVYITVMVNEPVAVLPWASVAEQLTVVVFPAAKNDGEGGLQRGVTGPSTRSVAVTV